MNNLFEEKRTLFLLLLSLIFLGLLAVYLFFLQPMSVDLQSKKTMNISLESDIALLEAKKNPEAGQEIDTLLLQKKVPLDPELEKLLLTFQGIEQTSGSRIEEISFFYNGTEPKFDFTEEEDATSYKNTDSETNKTDDENKDSKPENLHLVTAEVSVLSPDYEHFIKFIKEVEALERVTRVDQLEFIKPTEKELDFQANPNTTVEFIVTVTTFYYK